MKFLFLLLFLLQIIPLRSEESLAFVLDVVGSHSIFREGISREIKPKMFFHKEDEIQTGPKGHVDIQIDETIVLRISAKSKFTLSNFEKANDHFFYSLHLSFGEAFIRVYKKILGNSECNFTTPTRVVAVRGTKFILRENSQSEKEASGVFVGEGEVEVEDLKFDEKLKFTIQSRSQLSLSRNNYKIKKINPKLISEMKFLDTLKVFLFLIQ